MKVVLDIECNSLDNPDKVWCVVCKSVDTNTVDIFRGLTDGIGEKERFQEYARQVDLWIGHNILGYDLPILDRLGILPHPPLTAVFDTLIASKLYNYSRVGGHSIEQYGLEFGMEKMDIGKSVAGHNPFFNQWSEKMEEYCVRDVDICHQVYDLYHTLRTDSSWVRAFATEQRFQQICNDLHANGFAFNSKRANSLLSEVEKQLAQLDKEIKDAFPPRLRLIREVVPKITKHGTLSRTDFRWVKDGDLSEFNGGPFCRCEWEEFNPSSHKQLIEVLSSAHWSPTDKTKTHIETERELNRLKRSRSSSKEEVKELEDKLVGLQKTGWQINEQNLSTLPETAPAPARLLAQRILLESRRRSLVEWISLVGKDGRIYGEFQGLGAWTHRMSHRNPNTANIPREFKEDGTPKLLGRELRELWCAPKNRLLVGVDAEGIQLRIFAHYIDDEEFTYALVQGKKVDKTDPHSLNQRIIGSYCKTRQAAKRFIYALLLGGGLPKLAEILDCSVSEAREALDRVLERYTGFAKIKKHVIPEDAKRGYFIGLDGRQVLLPGVTQRDREHLAMSGYLQNGEAIVVKTAAILIDDQLKEEKKKGWWKFVDIVHDELQSEVRNSVDFALKVAKIKAEAIAEAGRMYNLKCPMAGSYYNDDIKDYTIGTNWYQTH